MLAKLAELIAQKVIAALLPVVVAAIEKEANNLVSEAVASIGPKVEEAVAAEAQKALDKLPSLIPGTLDDKILQGPLGDLLKRLLGR
jgi:hypothetical protein